MININQIEDTPTVQEENRQTNYLNINIEGENCESLENSFEYVDCGYNFIENTNEFVEDEQITSTKLILQKNQETIRQLEEVLEVQFKKAHESNTEINGLENELKALEQTIFDVFISDDYNLHMIKQHNIEKFQDLGQFIGYFYFLLSKSIIYDGWHTFHCVQCMQFVTKNKVKVLKQIQNYLNLQEKIYNLKLIQ